jgi:hypothetical protein
VSLAYNVCVHVTCVCMHVCVGAVRESVGTHEVVCSDVTCQVKSEDVGGFAKQMSSVSRVSELCMDGGVLDDDVWSLRVGISALLFTFQIANQESRSRSGSGQNSRVDVGVRFSAEITRWFQRSIN